MQVARAVTDSSLTPTETVTLIQSPLSARTRMSRTWVRSRPAAPSALEQVESGQDRAELLATEPADEVARPAELARWCGQLQRAPHRRQGGRTCR